MKIQLLSDLHLEFRGHPQNADDFIISLYDDADVLVLAGDITVSEYLRWSLKTFCKLWENVVYVCGNHEYYHASFNTVHRKLKKLQEELPNLHWLHGSWTEIKGKKFLGGTLWFPSNELSRDPFYQRQLSDFRCITGIRKSVFTSHNKTVKFLKNQVEEGDIVVTHHLPSELSVPRRFKGQPTNCFYVSNQSDIMLDNKPALWFHGHTHDSCDYTIGDTRVLANPYGYWQHETNPDWKSSLIVEV